MGSRKNWFSKHWENILDNLIANIIWIVLVAVIGGILGGLSKNADFLKLAPKVGTFIAAISYILLGMGIALLMGGLFLLIKMKSITDKRKMEGEKEHQQPSADWDNVAFGLSERGIEIKNGKSEIIQKCYVEIIQIYDENFVPLYGLKLTGLPSIVGWDDVGTIRYDETDLRIDRPKKFVLISEIQWFMGGGKPNYYIGGKNGFQHDICVNSTRFVEMEASGVTGNASLNPVRKFVTVSFDGQIVTVKDMSNAFPKINN